MNIVKNAKYQTGLKLFKCQLCTASFSSKALIKRHIDLLHSLFESEQCGKDFKTQRNLEKQKKIQYNQRKKPLQCSTCGKLISSKYSLRNHQKLHNESEKETCNICGKKVIDLNFHRKLHMAQFKCAFCPKVMTSKQVMRRHVETHENAGQQPHACHLCKKSYKTRGYLLKHISYIHKNSQKNKWKCETCGKFFAQYGSLSIHRRMHIGKKIACIECDQKFLHKHHLKTHMERLHLSQGKSFECQKCEKTFKTNVDLKKHQIEHSYLKPFKCPKCEHRSKYRNNMASHITKHNEVDKKSFQCQLCIKTFKSSKHLTKHTICHFDGKPFACLKCEYTTKYERALKKHMKTFKHEKNSK